MSGAGNKIDDDEWHEQTKRDIASGKLDDVLREVEEDIKASGNSTMKEMCFPS